MEGPRAPKMAKGHFMSKNPGEIPTHFGVFLFVFLSFLEYIFERVLGTLKVTKIEQKASHMASFGGAFLSFFEAGGRVILNTPIEKITSWPGLGGSERALKTDLGKGRQRLLN